MLLSVNCLHSALFVCTALIISVLRSVDNLASCLHAVYTCLHSSTLVCTLCALSFALVCTCLHAVCTLVCTRLHLSALVSTSLITHVSTQLHDGHATCTIRHRGSDFLIRATERTTSLYCSNRLLTGIASCCRGRSAEEELVCRQV